MADYFYNPIIQNIAMVKNDTMSFGFQLKGLEGQTPTEIYFTCKENPNDSAYLFQRIIGNGIILKEYDPTTDTLTYTVRIAPENTENIEIGRYFYDLEIHVNKDTFTLLKGVLTIDYEVTARINEDPHDPEDGDNKYYPIGAPEGKLKYTELYISDIAQGILNINEAEETYRVSDMVAALAAIRSELDDISDAINEKTGGSSLIPLNNMVTEIESIVVGLPVWEAIKLDLKRINTVRGTSGNGSGLAYFPDNSTYGIIPTNESPRLMLAPAYPNRQSKAVSAFGINNDQTGAPGTVGNDTDYTTLNSRANYDPYFNGDFNWNVYGGTALTTPLLDCPARVSDLDYNNSHPFLRDYFKDEALVNSIKSTLELATWKDVLDCNFEGYATGKTLEDIKGIVFINTNGSMMLLMNEANAGVFNTNTGNYNGATGYYNQYQSVWSLRKNLAPPKYAWSAKNWGVISNFGSFSGGTLSTLEGAVLLNTVPIKDQNGDVILPANCTLADFGL